MYRQKHLYNSLLNRLAPQTDTRTPRQKWTPWVFNGTSSPEDSRAEGQGSWLPGHERAAGRPLVLRLVSPYQPGGRRQPEALEPGRGHCRSQGDELGREEAGEDKQETNDDEISSEHTLYRPPPAQRTLLSSPLALPLDGRPHVTPHPLPIGQACGGRGTPSLGRSLQRGAFVAPPTASPQTACFMATVLGLRRSAEDAGSPPIGHGGTACLC